MAHYFLTMSIEQCIKLGLTTRSYMKTTATTKHFSNPARANSFQEFA